MLLSNLKLVYTGGMTHPIPARTGQSFVAYYRVSSKRQDHAHRAGADPSATGGYSLETQQDAVRAYVHAVKGTLVAEYRERESARARSTQARPQLRAALDAANAQSAVLVIAKLDRLARNVHFLSGLLESGVEFVALDLPGANKFTLHVMAAVAQQESERISERVRAGHAKARARGVKLGGMRPAMLTAQPWHLGGGAKRDAAVTYYREQNIDRLIAALRGPAKFGYLRVAKQLMADGVRTSTGATTWSADHVRKVHLMMEQAKKEGAA
jgi:DNA invertase Pin-like site-specific DNA recombinase